MLSLLIAMVIGAAAGVVLGLIPFFIGKSQGKPNMGQWALIWSIAVGAISGGIGALFVMVGFIIAILTTSHDFRPLKKGQTYVYTSPSQPTPQPQPVVGGMCLRCLSGPLGGRTYSIGSGGITIGRDVDCTIQFPAGSSGISRHHCALRWQQGALMLVDLGSKFGTFQGDGRQLPQNYPVVVTSGSRFYLANPTNLFQVDIQ